MKTSQSFIDIQKMSMNVHDITNVNECYGIKYSNKGTTIEVAFTKYSLPHTKKTRKCTYM